MIHVLEKINKMTKKVMELLDENNGLMRCRICGKTHFANLQSGIDRANGITSYYKGSWQCSEGCKFPKLKCKRCNHEWEYTGSKLDEEVDYPQFVQCPKCRTSVKLILK